MEEKNQTSDWTKVSEVELIYKSKVKASERPKISDSREAYAFTHVSLGPEQN